MDKIEILTWSLAGFGSFISLMCSAMWWEIKRISGKVDTLGESNAVNKVELNYIKNNIANLSCVSKLKYYNK